MERSHASIIRAANHALIEQADIDAVADYFAPHYVAHATDADFHAHDFIRSFIATIRRAFPDLRSEVEILVESDDRVAWHRTLRATHKGAFKGFPPTGKPIVWRDAVTSRFEDGLIVEDWVISDLAERLLGARKA
jgi:predicted ester cyclase